MALAARTAVSLPAGIVVRHDTIADNGVREFVVAHSETGIEVSVLQDWRTTGCALVWREPNLTWNVIGNRGVAGGIALAALAAIANERAAEWHTETGAAHPHQSPVPASMQPAV